MTEDRQSKYASLPGLMLTIAVGYVLYYAMKAVGGDASGPLPTYSEVVNGISEPSNQLIWFLVNWTEAEFFAGPIATIFLFIGGVLAYLLAIKGSRWQGIEICYGEARIFPWVVASQVLSLLVTLYLFGYLGLFRTGLGWIPTFIVIVGLPPSMVLMYGPGWATLITSVLVGGAICTPTAWFISQATAGLNIPGAVNNVLAMTVSGIIGGSVIHVLPWMKKTKVAPTNDKNARPVDMTTPFWVLRRTLADFTEPQFWGNEIASAFVIIGMIVELIVSPGILLGGGAKMLPAVILSQFISGGIGVFLYTRKYAELGWYATYVPVVCTAPAVVLMFGDTMPVIITTSIISGVIGAPIAEYFGRIKPDYVHGTVNNVTAMALSTVIVAACIKCISWLGAI